MSWLQSTLLCLAVLCLAVLSLSCEGGVEPARPDANYEIRNGCPVLRDPLASPGDPIGGDTWGSYAGGFFEDWCVRCHSTTLTTPEQRNGAPADLNWDDPKIVRDNLDRIRHQVGITNAMPFTPPNPPCTERARIVRWIDADAP